MGEEGFLVSVRNVSNRGLGVSGWMIVALVAAAPIAAVVAIAWPSSGSNVATNDADSTRIAQESESARQSEPPLRPGSERASQVREADGPPRLHTTDRIDSDSPDRPVSNALVGRGTRTDLPLYFEYASGRPWQLAKIAPRDDFVFAGRGSSSLTPSAWIDSEGVATGRATNATLNLDLASTTQSVLRVFARLYVNGVEVGAGRNVTLLAPSAPIGVAGVDGYFWNTGSIEFGFPEVAVTRVRVLLGIETQTPGGEFFIHLDGSSGLMLRHES
jgi:hypothetical protein